MEAFFRYLFRDAKKRTRDALSLSVERDAARPLFNFGKTPQVLEQWHVITDRQVGGFSTAHFESVSGAARFHGHMSLACTGKMKRSGFASAMFKTESNVLDLDEFDAIDLRVRGDGRTYVCNLHCDSWFLDGWSLFQAFMYTDSDKWTTVRIPFRDFVQTHNGFVQPEGKLNAGKVTALGIALMDRKEGPFRLDVETITAVRTDAEDNGAAVERAKPESGTGA